MRGVYAATSIAIFMAGAAQATTITNDRLVGTPYELDPAHFFTFSEIFEPGPSVTTSFGVPVDGRRAYLKNRFDAVSDGRFNPDGVDLSWVDSADIGLLQWDVEFETPMRAFGFGVTDAADTPTRFAPEPFWQLIAASAVASAERHFGDDPFVTWYTIFFDNPTSSVSLTMFTGIGDGYGITSATMSAVPLPAGVWLLLTSLGGLFGISRWRRRVAA